MEQTIDFCEVKAKSKSIHIDDIGNVAIEISIKEEYSYLIIKTSMGETEIVQYGPIVPDIDLLCKRSSCTYMKIDYSESSIIKIINSFLNPKGNNVVDEAKILTFDEACDSCINIIDYIRRDRDE